MKDNQEWFLKDKKPKKFKRIYAPEEFDQAIRIRAAFEGFPTVKDYLKDLAPKLRPTIKDLRDKGFLREYKDEDFEFEK